MRAAASQAHWRAMDSARGLDAVIIRAGVRATVRVVPAESQFEIQENDGSTTVWRSSDFLIPELHYAFSSDPVEPEKGDLIEVNDTLFRVGAPVGEKVWKYLGHVQEWRVIRVHTVQS